MNSRNPMKTIRWVAIGSLMSTVLAGCSTPYHAAPISSVEESSSAPVMTAGNDNNSTSVSTPMPVRPQLSSANNTQPVSRSVQQPRAAGVQTSNDGRIQYNRNYDAIPKGSYNGNTYTVQRGDTLFYIAYISGSDFRELAAQNNIPEPYSLNEGQVIRLSNGGNTVVPVSSGTQVATNKNTPQNRVVDSQPTNAYSESSGAKPAGGKMLSSQVTAQAKANNGTAATTAATTAAVTAPATTTSAPVAVNSGSFKWGWPAEGKVISNYTGPTSGNRGIDIGGTRGQPVFASAPGKVVYTGNALRGYGNLVIIKHNDDFLTAYAHNDSILVKDQQDVAAGQKIATMGSSGTTSVRLHFEIRYKGKSVNPLQYLPQR
ncbi:murein hydrolase activator NlpD [Morganella morganii]|uniref:murein hydrolase activator NlpD n=1 Tax=Morganella morganii TaxID=582 RepID=UPI001E628A25|nr:murein hydrolase activator NlpD [Morganella morganii]UFH67982.1 murein hydrolase activator NlpD [Morganella morganii]